MDNVAIIFSKDGIRICHGINPEDYKDRTDVLINPKIPRGIPPHLWQKIGNEIKVIGQDTKIDIKNEIITLKNKLSKKQKIMINIIIMTLSVAFICYICRYI